MMKKIIAIFAAASMVLALTACGKTPQQPEPTTEAVAEITTEASGEIQTQTASEETQPETEAEETTETPELSATQQVLDLYVTAAKKAGMNITVNRSKTLTRLNGGSGAAGNLISSLEKIAKSVLANQSGEDAGVRGYPELLTEDDITSAGAIANGDITEVTLKIKDYTAMPTGRANEGSVGHAIGVLDTIDEALNELPLNVDDPSNIRLRYTNASIKAKINTKTQTLVSAEWVYDVAILINNTKCKMGISFTLDGAEASIHYVAKY